MPVSEFCNSMPKRFSKQSRKSVGHQNKVFKTSIRSFEVGMKEPFKGLPTYSSLFLFFSRVITLLKRGFATDFSAIFHNDRKAFTNTNRELKMNKIQLCSQTAIDCNEIKKSYGRSRALVLHNCSCLLRVNVDGKSYTEKEQNRKLEKE